jgi:hypothetical protein
MKVNDRQNALDGLLSKAMDSEVPPEVEARLRQYLAGLQEKMESSKAEPQPRARRVPLGKGYRRLAWACGSVGLFLLVVALLACFILAREVVDLRHELKITQRDLALARAGQEQKQTQERQAKERVAISSLQFRIQELEERFQRFSYPSVASYSEAVYDLPDRRGSL